QADSVSGRRVGILADDQHPHPVEREGEGAQHVLSGRQISTPGGQFLPEELAHGGDLLLDRLQGLRPAIVDEFAQRLGGHTSPLTNSTTVSAPAPRSFEISWYSADSDHRRN